MSLVAGEKLANNFYPAPGRLLPMVKLRKTLLPLRRNQLILLTIKQAIVDFNREHPTIPIKLATVKKCSLTNGLLVWGSDIDWLTFYGDCPTKLSAAFNEAFTHRLHADFGISFSDHGEKDEHNHIRFFAVGKMAEIDYADPLLTIIYDGKDFPRLNSQDEYQPDKRHLPLDTHSWRVLARTVGRIKLFRAFNAIANAEINQFITPPPLCSSSTTPQLHEEARGELARLMKTPILPSTKMKLYQSILLQLHYLRFGAKLGLASERTWFVPVSEEDAIRKAFCHLVKKGLLYLPFSGGVVPAWDLFCYSSLEAGLQSIDILLFDDQGGLIRWPAASEVEAIPATEKQLRAIAQSNRAEDIAKIITALGPGVCSLVWLAVEILDSRHDTDVIVGLLQAIASHAAIVKSDDQKTTAKDDLIRQNALWILSRKSRRSIEPRITSLVNTALAPLARNEGNCYTLSAQRARLCLEGRE